MSDIRRKLAVVRRALEDCGQRLAALRERLLNTGASGSPEVTEGGSAPLFQAALPLDDRELHFEALDTEDPGRNER